MNYCMRLMRFDFTISHVPGKSLILADVLSRFLLQQSKGDSDLSRESDLYDNEVIRQLPAEEERLVQIRNSQGSDPVCRQVIEFCKSGWPTKGNIASELRKYMSVSSELSGSC